MGIQLQNDEPPKHQALKVSRAYTQESHKGLLEMRDFRHSKNLTCFKFQHRDYNLKGAWVRPLANLGKPPKRVGSNWGSS